MAKHQNPPAATPKAEPPVVVESPKDDPLIRFYVHLAAPTPLAVNPAIVEAKDESAARLKFESLNGIGNSTHPYTIRPATEADEKA